MMRGASPVSASADRIEALYTEFCGAPEERYSRRVGERPMVLAAVGADSLQVATATAWLMERDVVRAIISPAEFSPSDIARLKSAYPPRRLLTLSEALKQRELLAKARVIITDIPAPSPFRWADIAMIGNSAHAAEDMLAAAAFGLPMLGDFRAMRHADSSDADHAANLLTLSAAIQVDSPQAFARHATWLLYDARRRHMFGAWAREYAEELHRHRSQPASK